MYQSIHLRKKETDISHVIKQVVINLQDLNCTWAIVGSCNLYIRGCLPSASDIDIITDHDGAVLIADSLDQYTKRKLAYSEAENIRSEFFQAAIGGYDIEVMSTPENKINGRWIRNADWNFNIEHIFCESILVPVTTLSYEKCINQKIGNWKRVEEIQRCLMDALVTPC